MQEPAQDEVPRAKREHLEFFEGVVPESQGQNLALYMCHIRSREDGEKYRALKLEAADVMQELAEDPVTAQEPRTGVPRS
jgi:hypothetical protein